MDADSQALDTAFSETDSLGEPIPAHLLVVAGGSPRFRAHAERWAQETDSNSRPVLRVSLERVEDVPHALSALRFMYTGTLDVSTMGALLHVRRMAAYLQVEGCMEACDAAISNLISQSPAVGQGGQKSPLQGAADFYVQRNLLPDTPAGDDAVLNLLHVCRQQLVRHSGSVPDAGPLVEGGPSLGELLAWAFRDAPTLLSWPEMRKQMEMLSASAMEALLRCDGFATDNEASVLLVLACWLVSANKMAADPTGTRARLCKLLRLSHLSSSFLLAVLPCLPWFPITPEEHRFLSDYATAPPVQRVRMAAAAEGLYDCKSAWYAAPARPRLPVQAVRLYEWTIQEKDLEAALKQNAAAELFYVHAKFTNGVDRVVSHGMEWYASLGCKKGKDAAGAFLYCTWPSVLKLQNEAKVVALMQPGPVVLRVEKGPGGGRGAEPAWQLTCGQDVYVRGGGGWGTAEALPLQVAGAAKQDEEAAALKGTAGSTTAATGSGSGAGSNVTVPPLLAPWVPYLRDGCVRGSLRWTW